MKNKIIDSFIKSDKKEVMKIKTTQT